MSDNLGKIANTRNECNEYTCSCHSKKGIQLGKSITAPFVFSDKKEFAEQEFKRRKDMLPKEMQMYCKFKSTTVKIDGNPWYYYYICETPMYFMNQLAMVMGGAGISSFVMGDTPEKYETAKKGLIVMTLRGTAHPHFADTYIILSE